MGEKPPKCELFEKLKNTESGWNRMSQQGIASRLERRLAFSGWVLSYSVCKCEKWKMKSKYLSPE